MSASWVFGVNIFDLDLEVQIDSIKQPIKTNSVSPGHVSHRWTSSFNYHFDHGFKEVQLETHFDQNVCWWVRNPTHSSGNFSVAPAEIRDWNIFLYLSIMFSSGLHSR